MMMIRARARRAREAFAWRAKALLLLLLGLLLLLLLSVIITLYCRNTKIFTEIANTSKFLIFEASHFGQRAIICLFLIPEIFVCKRPYSLKPLFCSLFVPLLLPPFFQLSLVVAFMSVLLKGAMI